jgi:DNA-binding response OmpR family regulator
LSELKPAAKRILVIEDEIGYQELLQNILGKIYDLTICSSGEEAMGLLEIQTYDLVIADINLQGLTGFTVLEKVKSLGRLKSSPVIMCSSQDDQQTRKLALENGAAGFIPKPYEFETMTSTITSLLSKPA